MISPQRILHRDHHLLVIEKLAGELVVRGKGEVGKLPLLDFLRRDFPGIRALHRLDFDTSGILVFALTKEAYEAVRESQFAGWRKTYQTLVMGVLPRQSGAIRTPLPAREGGMVPAETTYRVLETFANSSFVEAEIVSGRHHQIRRHFAAIGHPLALDPLYGHKKFDRLFARELKFHRFFLHASRITFPHPVTGEEMRITCEMPRAFQSLLKKLRSL